MIWNPEAEAMSRAARERLQAERLRETLGRVVERVAFYRERLGAIRVDGVDDLPALPFTRKSALRDQYPLGLFAVPLAEVARLHASSGTKGKPTLVGYTAGDLDVWREVMARAMVAAGARQGDLLHVAFGYGLFRRRGDARAAPHPPALRGHGGPRRRARRGAMSGTVAGSTVAVS